AKLAAGDNQGIRHISSLAALTGTYDLDAIACAQLRLEPRRTRHDGAVDGDCDSALAGIDRLLLEQRGKRRNHQWLGFTVDPDVRPRRRPVHRTLLFFSPSKEAKSPDPESTEHHLHPTNADITGERDGGD